MGLIRGIVIALVMGISSGCVAKTAQPIGAYYPKKIHGLESIVSLIEARNKNIESHPQWRTVASQRILLRSLEDIPQSDYEGFRDYLDDGVMYIIVHPAYYFFFHDDPDISLDRREMQEYLDRETLSKTSLFLREQERALRDFLEITSTRDRLLFIILPGNYREYSGYKYRYGEDEFSRYINEVTNGSKATIVLYSEKPNRGMLDSKSMGLLLNFINTISPEKIVLGGGYLGRCLEDFYRQLAPYMKEGQVEIEPWISALSPEDIRYFDLDDLIKGGRLDMSLLKELQKNYSYTRNNSFRELLKNYKNNKGKQG